MYTCRVKRATQLVFSTPSYAALQARICALGNFEAGKLEIRAFPDDERYLRLLQSVANRDVVLLGGTISDADTLTLYDLACGMVADGAHTLTLVMPYFGYATMERAVRPGDVVTAKTRAQLFSHIRSPGSGSRVVLLDLHSEGIPFYFEGALRPVHLYAKPLILAAARRLGGQDFVLACTDAGRAKWVESLANDLHVPAAFVFKRRDDGRHTEVVAINAQVQGRCVVLYDDMIRTGGSLIQAAQAYRNAGAASLAAIATHGVFPGDALARIQATGLFSTIVCTDSHPRALALQSDFLQIDTLADLFTDYLKAP